MDTHTDPAPADPAGPAINTPTIPPVVLECQALREKVKQLTAQLEWLSENENDVAKLLRVEVEKLTKECDTERTARKEMDRTATVWAERAEASTAALRKLLAMLKDENSEWVGPWEDLEEFDEVAAQGGVK